MTRRGGVLLDLFLILVIIGGAAAAWVFWRRGGMPDFVRRLISAAPVAAPSALGKEAPAEPDIDVSDRAAWIQGRVRDLLAKHGVKDKHVLKTYNAQRQEGGIQWLEGNLEVRRPARFDEKKFLADLGPVLAEKKLSLMEDNRADDRWTVAVGDRKRIYQRVVFEH